MVYFLFFSMTSDFPIDSNQLFENVQSASNNNNKSLKGLFLVGLTGMYAYFSFEYLQVL